MLRFAYTGPDGKLRIVTAAPKEHLERLFGRMTLAEYRQHVIDRSIPSDAVGVEELSDAWQPPDVDRKFRNAWTLSGPEVVVDMTKAREIWRDSLREMRDPILVALDADYMKADEIGDEAEKQRIAAEKQELRDVTVFPAIESAKSPVELREAIPDVLK